jgi:hypothetical protein
MGLFAALGINDTQHKSFERRYDECRVFIVMLSVIILNVITMCVVALFQPSVITLAHFARKKMQGCEYG